MSIWLKLKKLWLRYYKGICVHGHMGRCKPYAQDITPRLIRHGPEHERLIIHSSLQFQSHQTYCEGSTLCHQAEKGQKWPKDLKWLSQSALCLWWILAWILPLRKSEVSAWNWRLLGSKVMGGDGVAYLFCIGSYCERILPGFDRELDVRYKVSWHWVLGTVCWT